MLSFICATNNLKMLNECLEASLLRQDNQNYELIIVDTIKRHFDSAVEALNYGASKAKGDYLVFIHQDIVFNDETVVDQLLDMCNNEEFLIAGCAGAVPRGKYGVNIVSNIVHGNPPSIPGPVIENVQPVETVDECLFVIPAEVFEKRKLEKMYNTWHMYSVEYCLWAHEQDFADPVKVFPVKLWHLSSGASLSKDYFEVLKILRKRYPKDIYMTTSMWPKNFIMYLVMKCHRRKQWRL